MASEPEERFFERVRGGSLYEGGRRIERNEAAPFEDSYAMSEELDFRERVGSEKKRGCAGLQDLRSEEMAERCGGDGVEAACGFVKEKNARQVHEGASETETLDGAGGERADLAVEGFGELELRGELSDAIACDGAGKMIELAEEDKILAASEAGVETEVAAGVVAEIAADFSGGLCGVVAGDGSTATRGEKKRRENPEQGGFAGAVGPE